MARIRTIKPEFWVSEQIVECSIESRLMFIGLWNFCDDNGIQPASPKRIKMQIFPADDISPSSISRMLAELFEHGLIDIYVVDGTEYLIVTGWAKHQKIDRPNFRYPLPGKAETNNTGKTLGDNSTSNRRAIDEQSTSNPPRKGREGNGYKPPSVTTLPQVDVKTSAEVSTVDRCPVSKIVDLFHQKLPNLPHCKKITAARRSAIRQRHVEDMESSLETWSDFFDFVAKSDFLMGKTRPGNGRTRPFVATLDWLVKAENFAKIYEGKYHHG